MNTALNRTSVALLTNKSGGSVAQGDVVVIDAANAAAFTTTTTSGYVNGLIGVVLEPNGIASNGIGAVALGGYVPIINLSSSASLGDVFKTHSVAKQAVRHAGPVVAGDFGQVLGTGTTPAALLGELPAQAGFTPTVSSNILSADVTMTTPDVFYDGPSLTLAAGTWILMGTVNMVATAGAATMAAKLWDGTTILDSGSVTTAAANYNGDVALLATVQPTGSTTYKISGACTGTGGKMKAAPGGDLPGNFGSTLYATRIF